MIYSIVDCQNGSFTVLLDFESENTSDSFTIVGNGNDYGTFSYANLPLTLGPLPADNMDYEFVAFDVDSQNCTDFVETEEQNCEATGSCEISNITVAFDECTSDTTYRVFVDFDFVGTGGVGFDLFANGAFFEFYSYNDLPLTINNFPLGPGQTNSLLICDNDNAICCEEAVWLAPNCGSNLCSIYDVMAEVVECENGEFFVILDFEFDNVSDSFLVIGNGISYGDFSYGQVPFTLGPLQTNQMVYNFLVIDAADPDCADFIELGVVECDSMLPSSNCDIDNLTAVEVGCIGDTIVFEVNFEVDSGSVSGFYLQIDDNMIQSYEYSELPLLVSTIYQPGAGIALFVYDQLDNTCGDTLIITSVACDSILLCTIFNLDVDFDECTSDTTYRVFVDFDFVGTGGVGFDLFANGAFFEFYSYNELPLTINNFPLGPGQTNGLLICDNDNANCCEDASWPTPNCGFNLCAINDVSAEVVDCENGEFFVILDFEFDNVSDSFLVNGNGISYGDFSYGQLPLTLGPFQTNQMFYEFVVADASNPNCSDFIELGIIECGNGDDCEISDPVAQVSHCEGDSVFVFVDFDYNDVGANGFEIIGNGLHYGNFEYNDLPALISFVYTPGDFVDLIIRDLDHPNYLNYTFIDEVICDECEIADLTVNFQGCASDSTYDFILDFEVNGAVGGFILFANGDPIGSYGFSALPLLIENFNSSGVQIDVFEVCDTIEPNCCLQATLPVPSCITAIFNPDELDDFQVNIELGYWHIITPKSGEIVIYDLTGRRVRDGIPIEREQIIKDLAPGVYVVKWMRHDDQLSKSVLFIE